MAQSILLSSVFCYVTIAAIVARPLPIDIVKRQNTNRQMEDIQLSEKDLQTNGETLPGRQDGIKFFSSSHINLWNNAEIPYTFAKGYKAKHKKIARKAMDMWSENTCIKFRKIKNSELRSTSILNYVRIQYGNVSNSYIGRRTPDWATRGQELNIKEDQGDKIRLYLHEFGHVIGFNHEHSRKDRDKYVKINLQNIKEGVEHNFDKLNYYIKETPYDYYSIMHYAVYDYALDRSKKTIEILNPNNRSNLDIDYIGVRRRLTKEDIAWANKLYKCPVPTVGPDLPQPNYKQFKVELPHPPDKIPSDGYIRTPKRYLRCSSTSCDVKGIDKVTLYITKLGSNTANLRIGDEVLLSSHRSAPRRGEWILCDESSGCSSSRACLVDSHNVSSGKVNFAFNRSDCKEQVLKISSKTQQQNETLENSSRIVLEYSNPRKTQEWIDCNSGLCKRTGCKQQSRRTNLTNLRKKTTSTTCEDQMDEFEAIFLS